jgi:hypothetical protein
MTESCKPIGWLSFADLFEGRLQQFGVYERVIDQRSTETFRSLTDGRNSLWVNGSRDGGVTELTLKGSNRPDVIFDAIFQEFKIKIVTEREPEFWGFQTREEWREARSRGQRESLYRELRKYLDGRPNDIETDAKAYSEREGAPSVTVGLIKAQVAKQLVAEDPTLLDPAKGDELTTKVLARVAEIRKAFAWDDEDYRYARQYNPSLNGRLEAEEDVEDGPLPAGAYIFTVDLRGVIVARERPGIREATGKPRDGAGGMDDEIPF